ncbi:hypothetical protein AMTR_s00001p00266940 [Amborella trichopoda]|uniref:Uncharacterized protein n=1 Tax=Amborella trichopoda TaxID=13333 RepID=W1NLW4_AMBTC|nr:hypothetical protein AMTR_s00001p00266940 [Amborella trichopoda]
MAFSEDDEEMIDALKGITGPSEGHSVVIESEPLTKDLLRQIKGKAPMDESVMSTSLPLISTSDNNLRSQPNKVRLSPFEASPSILEALKTFHLPIFPTWVNVNAPISISIPLMQRPIPAPTAIDAPTSTLADNPPPISTKGLDEGQKKIAHELVKTIYQLLGDFTLR